MSMGLDAIAAAAAAVDEYCDDVHVLRACVHMNRTASKWIARIAKRQVQTVSISYLRCLIEHVRCYILDRDIELIYYTIRKSSDVLTRDPMQLGAQVN